ncbi:helix-turn-helix domain-containing protein [Campylobacter concisus]|nr:helix-turn-helix domain-containing protein [Campylobacter concisus]
MNNPIKQNRWLTPKDVVQEYGISINTQAKYRMRGLIPFSKINKIIRYDRTKLDE